MQIVSIQSSNACNYNFVLYNRALTIYGPTLYMAQCKRATKEQIIPLLDKTSMLFDFRLKCMRKYSVLKNMVRTLEDRIMGNRAKLNYLQIKWDEQKDKLVGEYAKKNAKKKSADFLKMVGDISDIKREYRDHFLIRYIARCKLANALAFFQWRCMTLEDPAEVERNKDMFDARVRALINNITSSIEKKKTLWEIEGFCDAESPDFGII